MDSKISNQQIMARRYIEEYDLERVVSEMLNSLVHEKSKTPIVYMIKYLAGLMTEDERKNHALQIPEPYPKGKPIVKFPVLPEKSNSLLKKYLTKPIWSAIKYNKTLNNGSIMNMIKLGETDATHPVGITLTDLDCINQFSSLIDPIVGDLHELINKTNNSLMKPKYYLTNYKASHLVDSSKVDTYFPFQSSINESIKSLRIEFSRNIENYSFSCSITKEKRESVEKIAKSAILTLSADEPLLKKGKYYEILAEDEINIIALLNDNNIRTDLLDSYLINSNMKMNWPDNRGIFVSDNRELIILINFIDHIKLIFTYPYVSNFTEVFNGAFNLVKNFERLVTFETHSNYGYITSCPSLFGAGLEMSAELKLKNLNSYSNFTSIIQTMKFDHHSFDASKMQLTVKAKFKLNFKSEYEYLQNFYTKLSALVSLDEDKVKAEALNTALRVFENNSGETAQAYKECYEEFNNKISATATTLNSILIDDIIKKEKQYGGIVMKENSDCYFFFDFLKSYISYSQKYDIIKAPHSSTNTELKEISDIRQDFKILNIKIVYRRNLSGIQFPSSRQFDGDKSKEMLLSKLMTAPFEDQVLLNLDKYLSEEAKYNKDYSQMVKENQGNHEVAKIFSAIAQNSVTFLAEALNKVTSQHTLKFDLINRYILILKYKSLSEVTIIINDVDHLRIEYQLNESNLSKESITNFIELIGYLDSQFEFLQDHNFGYYGSLPKFYGNGVSLSTDLLLRKLNSSKESIVGFIEKFNLTVEELDSDTGKTRLTSNRSLGISESDAIINFMLMVDEVIGSEDLLSK